MLLLKLSSLLASAGAVFALPPEVLRLRQPKAHVFQQGVPTHTKRSSFYTPTFSNPKAADFHVNSSSLPLVTFPLQDSWAGRLPISNSSSEDKVGQYNYYQYADGGSKQCNRNCSSGIGLPANQVKVTALRFG